MDVTNALAPGVLGLPYLPAVPSTRVHLKHREPVMHSDGPEEVGQRGIPQLDQICRWRDRIRGAPLQVRSVPRDHLIAHQHSFQEWPRMVMGSGGISSSWTAPLPGCGALNPSGMDSPV